MLMRKLKFKILILFFIVFATGVEAQEMLGLAFGNYSGISSSFLNPALMTGSKAYIDINIFAGQAFAKNDWAYVPKEDMNIWELLQSDTLIPKYGKWRYNGIYTYYDNIRPKQVFQSARAIGPSAMFQGGNFAFGLSFSARAVSSATNIPFEIPIFIYEGLTYQEMQDVVYDDYNFNFSSMSWMEASAGWAWDFARPYKGKLTLGGSVKLDLAYHGAYSVNDHVNYIVYDPKTVQVFNYNAEFGFALPVNYDSADIINQGPTFKGIGGGVDIGFVYTRMKSSFPLRGESRACSKPYEDFIYKIGVSLLDLGAVYFNKNTQRHNFDNVSVFWAQFDTVEFHNINTSMKQLSEAFYGDPDKSETGDRMSIGLPTALSLQFEGHFSGNIYVSAMFMQPIMLNKKQLRRPSQIAIVPRFEHDILALSIPVSILQYEYVRVGAALRYGPLTIGSERLGTLLGLSDLDGVDIYVALKFSLDKGRCSSKNKGACSNTAFGFRKKFIPPRD